VNHSGSEQVGIDVPDSASHEAMVLDQEQHLVVGGGRHAREFAQQAQHLPAVAHIAASSPITKG
jgi:hypothetical protein